MASIKLNLSTYRVKSIARGYQKSYRNTNYNIRVYLAGILPKGLGPKLMQSKDINKNYHLEPASPYLLSHTNKCGRRRPPDNEQLPPDKINRIIEGRRFTYLFISVFITAFFTLTIFALLIDSSHLR